MRAWIERSGAARKGLARGGAARMVASMDEAPWMIATTWLEPLRVYPRWLVLLCVAIVAGGVLALIAKPLKWGLYAGLAGLLAVGMAGFAWWLEQ